MLSPVSWISSFEDDDDAQVCFCCRQETCLDRSVTAKSALRRLLMLLDPGSTWDGILQSDCLQTSSAFSSHARIVKIDQTGFWEVPNRCIIEFVSSHARPSWRGSRLCLCLCLPRLQKWRVRATTGRKGVFLGFWFPSWWTNEILDWR